MYKHQSPKITFSLPQKNISKVNVYFYIITLSFIPKKKYVVVLFLPSVIHFSNQNIHLLLKQVNTFADLKDKMGKKTLHINFLTVRFTELTEYVLARFKPHLIRHIAALHNYLTKIQINKHSFCIHLNTSLN